MTPFPLCRACLLFLLAFLGSFTCHAILLPRLECYIKFARLDFNISKFDQYSKYFRNDSIMELAEMGYSAPDFMEEFVRFTDPDSSPFTVPLPTYEDNATISYEGYENGQCKFLVILNTETAMDPNYSSTDVRFRLVIMLKLYLDFEKNYISRINVYYPEAYFKTFFGEFLDSDKTRKFICDTMTGPVCSGILDEPPDNCLDTLRALPLVGEGSRVDGYTQGCRAIHAVYSSVNTYHCPHLSFTPMPDVAGNINCQAERDRIPGDLFTPGELKKFNDVFEAAGIDPDTGIKIVDPAAPKPPPPCGFLGLGFLCFKGCGFFSQLLDRCTPA